MRIALTSFLRWRQDRLEPFNRPRPLSLPIEVLVQVGVVEQDLCSTLGDFYLCAPEDGVHHELAIILVGPVAVEVAAGEAEAPASILSLEGPRHRLDHPHPRLRRR